MIISIGKKTQISDVDFVIGIQERKDRITEKFYNECKKYFMSSYKAVFTKESIKDDIFQQSFVKLWTEIETRKMFVGDDSKIFRFDKKGNVRMLTCNLKTFLFDIAKNDYRDWLRSDRLTLEDDFESFAHMMEVNSAIKPEETTESIQEQIVKSCMYELPPRCKEILTMFYYEEMSLDEIIVARGEKNISKNGLKTSKHKCMDSFKSKVKDMFSMYKLKY